MKKIVYSFIIFVLCVVTAQSVFAGGYSPKTIQQIVDFAKVEYPQDENAWLNLLRAFQSYVGQIESASKDKKPVITMVRGKAAADFEIFVNEPFSIEGNNLISSVAHDARVFVGGVEAKVTQFGSTFLWVASPALAIGSYNLEVHNGAGKSVPVKVKVSGTTSPSVKVTSPNGGETLVQGQSKLVTWQANADTIDVRLWSSLSGTSDLAYGIANTGSYSWTVNAKDGPNADYKIGIRANKKNIGSSYDVSDGNFKISTEKLDLAKRCDGGAYVFTSNLNLGSKGQEVAVLQNFLKDRGFSTEETTGYFGQFTGKALATYQVSKGIGSGLAYFGPLTREVVNKDCSLSKEVKPEVTFVSANAVATTGTGANDDIGTFQIKYKVNAKNGNIYISRLPITLDYILDQSGVSVGGFTSSLVADATASSTAKGNYIIPKGEEVTFTLTVTAALPQVGNAGQYRLTLQKLSWATTDTLTYNSLPLGPEFKTNYLSLSIGTQKKGNGLQATVQKAIENFFYMFGK